MCRPFCADCKYGNWTATRWQRCLPLFNQYHCSKKYYIICIPRTMAWLCDKLIWSLSSRETFDECQASAEMASGSQAHQTLHLAQKQGASDEWASTMGLRLITEILLHYLMWYCAKSKLTFTKYATHSDDRNVIISRCYPAYPGWQCYHLRPNIDNDINL